LPIQDIVKSFDLEVGFVEEFITLVNGLILVIVFVFDILNGRIKQRIQSLINVLTEVPSISNLVINFLTIVLDLSVLLDKVVHFFFALWCLVRIFDLFVVLVELVNHFVNLTDDLFLLSLERFFLFFIRSLKESLRSSVAWGLTLVAVDIKITLMPLVIEFVGNFILSFQVFVGKVILKTVNRASSFPELTVKSINLLL